MNLIDDKEAEMAETKEYRVSQIDGRITWQVEELWPGGQVRGPYGTKEAAIHAEQKVAQEADFADALILTATVGRQVDLHDSFEKDAEGNWLCKAACSIEIENKEIAFTPGHTYTKGIPFGGIDVAEWLDKHF